MTRKNKIDTGVKLPVGDSRTIRVDDEGYLYDADRKVKLSPCCKAVVTVSTALGEGVLCCKGCWEEMDDGIGGPPIVNGKFLV